MLVLSAVPAISMLMLRVQEILVLVMPIATSLPPVRLLVVLSPMVSLP